MYSPGAGWPRDDRAQARCVSPLWTFTPALWVFAGLPSGRIVRQVRAVLILQERFWRIVRQGGVASAVRWRGSPMANPGIRGIRQRPKYRVRFVESDAWRSVGKRG